MFSPEPSNFTTHQRTTTLSSFFLLVCCSSAGCPLYPYQNLVCVFFRHFIGCGGSNVSKSGHHMGTVENSNFQNFQFFLRFHFAQVQSSCPFIDNSKTTNLFCLMQIKKFRATSALHAKLGFFLFSISDFTMLPVSRRNTI